jgi:osmotically-inducible protein OsmY
VNPNNGFSEGAFFMTSHSWMSNSNYGGEEKGSLPKEHINYGEKNKNMEVNKLDQQEKQKPTKTSSYNISPTGGDTNVSDDRRQRVIEALHQNQDIDSTQITVNMRENDMVELCGVVPDERMIEQASECLRNMGITNIDNDLKVQRI